MILVTGGAGFIGSNFVIGWLAEVGEPLVDLDKLTYAGNLHNLAAVSGDPRHTFVRGDIGNRALVASLLSAHRPRAIVHLAAESHVDRSIRGPADFIATNLVGTFSLLEETRAYWSALPASEQARFRFMHVSTDEVYGSLGSPDAPFTETNPYAPNSPYAASKAGSDHLVRAYHHTYGLPTIMIHSSNVYGPFQFPEKLIPLAILNAVETKPIPIYGDGRHVRDWLHVDDHCEALRAVLERGRPGETYNIGAANERANIEVAQALCEIFDALQPAGAPHSRLITFVQDRPGHDRRYAIDSSKLRHELGWQPTRRFEAGLRATAEWYLANMTWVRAITSGEYRDWIAMNYDNPVTL
ncbi:MAG TPA: dTDP-glucose 4,6-dehydratase [Burkholderiales bacterium]|nr:dTDP-glucose 4,6-dehydratase [Burkholderiales bacterium]